MTEPHRGQPTFEAGAPLSNGTVAVIMLHGRGASAQGFLDLAGKIDVSDVAFLAPQAEGNSWYPNSFLAPREDNEPYLGAALDVVDDAVGTARRAGIERDKIVIVGFSQGGCLASEYVARHPRRYAGLAALSGGLIGPPGSAFEYDGTLDGTRAFFGCSDTDPHIPAERVTESADVFEELGASVEVRFYEGMGHTIVDDEIDWLASLLEDVRARTS